jgi:hypothetical protein
MKGGETGMLGQAEGTQAVADRAWADGQQRPDRQRRGGGARAAGEGGEEWRQPSDKGGRQMQIGTHHDGPVGTVVALQASTDRGTERSPCQHLIQ